MKKKTAAIIFCILIFSLLGGCGQKTKIVPIQSKRHEKNDYENAIEVIDESLKDFKGCRTTEIRYAGDKETEKEAEKQKKVLGEVMILYTTLKTGRKTNKKELEPYSEYRYKWILTRDMLGPWELKNYGPEAENDKKRSPGRG